MTSSAPRRIASFIGAMILTLTTGTFGWASTTGVCPNTSAVTDSHTGSAAHSQLSATDPSPIVERSGSDWTTCLGSGGVWVYVVYQDGPVLANTCVSDFSTGRQALLSAGLELEDRSDSPGFICTMNGHPDHCVKGREFNGQTGPTGTPRTAGTGRTPNAEPTPTDHNPARSRGGATTSPASTAVTCPT